MHLLFAKNLSWKPYLLQEIRKDLLPELKESFKGLPVIGLEKERITLYGQQLGFSLDCMPETKAIEKDSIGEQVKAVCDFLTNDTAHRAQRVWPQVFSISSQYGIVTTGRCQLLYSRLQKELRNRNLLKGRYDEEGTALLKVCIFPERDIRFSYVNAVEKGLYFSLQSIFPGGFTTIADDKKAPSRAFKKLVEAQEVLGDFIAEGDTLLDIGASPGGWSYLALNQGARVTAIDRSELREDIMRHPHLVFVRGDAFTYSGQQQFDWVISDIICGPQRIFELIEAWVQTRRCQKFIFTIKFKGDEEYLILSAFKKVLKELPYHCILRQLNVNKNEVMIMGKRAGQESL